MKESNHIEASDKPRSGLVHRAGRMPLPLGTETAHGTVAGVRFDGVERYYFLRSNGGVAFMPADVIEGHPTAEVCQPEGAKKL